MDFGIEQELSKFDEAHPYPLGVQRWQGERLARQAAGELPEGPEQVRPAFAQIFIDDGAGAALNDTVPVPAGLAGIALGALATRALGGRPSAADSRAAVHLRIAVAAFEELGFVVEATKTECGTAIINLGFRVDVVARRIDCPLPKRRILLRDVRQLRADVLGGGVLQQQPVEQLTGRLANMAHALPELATYLVGGYAVASARLAPRRRASGAAAGGLRRRRPGAVRVRAGSRCFEQLLAMCDVAEHVLEANEGVALAAAEAFAARDASGTLTVITDASGEDGVGGYAFHPEAPGTVWVVSEEWPSDVREALSRAAAPRAERDGGEGPECSMPLAELFGAWAVEQAVRLSGVEVSAVVAIGDCAPAAAVLSAATSAGAQLRALAIASRRDVRQWLGVAVPRELNVDADILSHPARWGEVRDSATAAGLTVRRVRIPASCWAELRSAMALPMGREAAVWREAGEVVAQRS